MTDFPDLKFKAQVSFPASVRGGTGINIDQSNGVYTFNLDYSEIAPVPIIPPGSTDTTYVVVWDSITNSFKTISINDATSSSVHAIEVVIDGGSSVLTTGTKGYLSIPFNLTITEAMLLADQSGSVVIDIFKCTYAQFDAGATHPVAGDKITASAPPTISGATKSQDTTLTGWTTAVAAGSVLGFNVNSATTIRRVTLSLKYTGTS